MKDQANKISHFQHSSRLEVKSSENDLVKLKICRQRWHVTLISHYASISCDYSKLKW